VICQHWLDPVWHETLLLTVGVLGIVKQSPFKAGRALRELCAEDLAGDHRGRNVVLAGEALADVGEAGADRASAATVITRLVQVMQDRETPAPARRDAGHLLGRLGWEPEGGLDVWVEVPPGPFVYGDGKERRVIEVSYRIGVYPVTNKQFTRFVEAGGYGQRGCWSAEGWAWRTGTYDSTAPDDLKGRLSQRPAEKRDQPYWWGDDRLASPLCPVVGVSWFEAQAYCRWLALEVGLDPDSPAAPRLPTEEEWERAVRGTDGREYPWGDAWDRTRVNCADWWARRDIDELSRWWESGERKEANPSPTAVVAFPEGANPAELRDGAGNIWEWTGPWYREGEWRALCGGCWDSRGRRVRCASRFGVHPGYFSSAVGFRVVFPGSRPSES
jgi:formylglycine-generating enzyme required for sulfatase activity